MVKCENSYYRNDPVKYDSDDINKLTKYIKQDIWSKYIEIATFVHCVLWRSCVLEFVSGLWETHKK